jgi:hypothetical protein
MSAAMVAAGWMLAIRLAREAQQPQRRQWLLYWSLKGLLVPVSLWAVMNVGLSWYLQPFIPQIQAAQASGKGWSATYFNVLWAGGFIISSCWTPATLGWALAEATAGIDREVRANFKALCLTWLFWLGLPALALVWFGGWPTFGLAVTAILAPIAGSAPPILHAVKRPPIYARAIAKLKFGKYSEAEWEILRELEKREDDFEGWMMLAELYARHFHDLAEAEKTVLEACSQPGINASQLAAALHRLADWHLKFGSNPENARWALQIICDRFQGSHLAHMAQLRINQLPLTERELREQQVSKPIPLPALGDSLDAEVPAPGSKLPRYKAAQSANECVEKLKEDPNNVAAREKLARLFTEQLDQADLGIEQINLLLEMPDQEEGRRAEWWGLVAAWHLKYRQDPDAARPILERLVHEFPHTPQALAARRRIELIDAAQRSRSSSSRASA